MSDDGPRFAYVRQGMNRRITPTNRAGLFAFLGWIAALMPLVAIFVTAMIMLDGAVQKGAAVVVYLAAMAGWFVAMFRWMKARSEIIDMDELLELKRVRDRARDSGLRD